MNKYIVVILLSITNLGNAQIVSDARLWTAISINKEFDKFELSFNEEFRLDENMSHIDKVFSELGASYKILKGFDVSFNYRFSRENDYETGNYDLNSRIDLGLSYKHKINDFRISNRLKYQTETANPYENNPTYLRNKLTTSYKLNDIAPFISYEFFYQFNEESVINRTRISIGSKYKLNKNNSIKMFYIFEDKFNTTRLKHSHIYGINYSIDI
ncbi:MAG: DUF2490 domain-containing protein [Vicingaceae bacterium]|nr:DUF2490 domain-containing protein [Vicingaceae bacterium]